MCKMKSAIILKDRVFIPDYDSHTKMLEELGIEDTKRNAEKLFVRAELSPIDGDIFSNIDNWIFKVDQDIVPDWFVKEYEETRMRKAIKEWAKEHIHINENNLKIDSGMHWIKGGTDINICGSATVENIYGSATVKYICGSATVENIYGSATVENIYGSATVKYIYGSATVKYICDSATVENICDSATVITSKHNSWKNIKKSKLKDDATIKDNINRIVYQSGDWTFVNVKKEKIK